MASGRARRAIPGLAFVALFLAYFTLVELRYEFMGETARATVVRTDYFVHYGKHGTPYPRVSVQYYFTEAHGTPRTERDEIDADKSEPTVGRTIGVEYFPHQTGMARMASNTLAMAIAAIPILLAGFLCVVAYLQTLPKFEPLPPTADVQLLRALRPVPRGTGLTTISRSGSPSITTVATARLRETSCPTC